MADACLASWFALRTSGESHAILTLSANDTNSNNAINKVTQETQNLNRKQGTTFGPFPDVKQGRKTEVVAQECFSSLLLPEENMPSVEAIERCVAIEDRNIRESVCGWIARRKKIVGQAKVSKEEIEAAVNNAFQNQRRFCHGGNVRRQAMTIYQAKNREFDNVIVLWTYALGGSASDERKRRLLYNAITRAKKKCTVVVMGANRINEAPFALPQAQLELAG